MIILHPVLGSWASTAADNDPHAVQAVFRVRPGAAGMMRATPGASGVTRVIPAAQEG